MTLPFVQCATCRHFYRANFGGNYCDAFPKSPGIPAAIITGEHDHREPFPGDNGVRYQPIPEAVNDDE